MAGDRVQVLRLPERVGNRPVKDVNELAQIERGEEIFADLVRRQLTKKPTWSCGRRTSP